MKKPQDISSVSKTSISIDTGIGYRHGIGIAPYKRYRILAEILGKWLIPDAGPFFWRSQ